jgi:predicted aldo/keto reductase-like oxidoreductase
MGLDCFNLYQMHYVNDQSSLQQVLGSDGALIALKEAKQKGLIRHIGATGHVKRMLLELLKIPEIETVQFPFSPVDADNGQELLEAASRSNAGVIAMKPLAGGALKNASLSLKYILGHSVSVVIPGMDSIPQVEANAAVGSAPPGLSPEDRTILEQEAAALGSTFCRRCQYCLPCQQGIDIPMMFLLDGYHQRYNLQGWAKVRYEGLSVKPDACQDCGECEERCPYNLPIRRLLKEAAARLG